MRRQKKGEQMTFDPTTYFAYSANEAGCREPLREHPKKVAGLWIEALATLPCFMTTIGPRNPMCMPAGQRSVIDSGALNNS